MEKKILFYETPLVFDKSNWYEVFSAALGRMMVNQTIFLEQAGNTKQWDVDFTKGIIRFDKKMYPIQLIGTESTVSDSWRWGWDNHSSVSEFTLRLATELKALGEEWGLEPLTVPQFELTEYFKGHNLAMVACALSKETLCYYRCPHDQGAVFAAFPVDDEAFTAPIPLQTFLPIAVECLKKFTIDHKIFIQSFLHQNQTSFTWQQNFLLAHFHQDLRIEFEEVQEGIWRVKELKTI